MLLEYSQPLLVMALMVGVYLTRIAVENFTDQVLTADWPNDKQAVTIKKRIKGNCRFIGIGWVGIQQQQPWLGQEQTITQ